MSMYIGCYASRYGTSVHYNILKNLWKEVIKNMYTILINNNNTMIATVKAAIMQRSHLVDNLLFLCPKMYGTEDMSTYNSVLLEYLSPVSKTYRQEELVLKPELYKDHLQYELPVTTDITSEAGDVELVISFIKVEMGADGVPFERVRKVTGCKLKIIPTSNWAQFIPNESLGVIDQKIAQLIALQQGSGSGNGNTEDEDNDKINPSAIIDDNAISKDTTYSSQKIEDDFISEDELDESVKSSLDENVVTTDSILILDGGSASE